MAIAATQFIGRIFIALTLFAAFVPGADAASLSQKLAELGHPNTKMCQLPKSSKGLGKLLFIQFQQNPDSTDDERQAVAILTIITEALANSNQPYMGFEANRNWDTCRDRHPEYIYWRDYNDSWHLMNKAPLKYLSQVEKELAPELRGTPAEAFVLFSLGLVEQRLERNRASVAHFEEASEILAAGDDPHGIRAYVLVPLIHHHFGEDGDEATGQEYLNAYALIAEESGPGTDYLPLIKKDPVYPRDAFNAGIQGDVLVEFTVSKTGAIVNPVVVESHPPGTFDDAAIEAARSFRYIPKIENGKAVGVVGVRNRIVFSIVRTLRR